MRNFTSGAEGDPDGIGELLDAGLERGPGALVEGDILRRRAHRHAPVATRPPPGPRPLPQNLLFQSPPKTMSQLKKNGESEPPRKQGELASPRSSSPPHEQWGRVGFTEKPQKQGELASPRSSSQPQNGGKNWLLREAVAMKRASIDRGKKMGEARRREGTWRGEARSMEAVEMAFAAAIFGGEREEGARAQRRRRGGGGEDKVKRERGGLVEGVGFL